MSDNLNKSEQKEEIEHLVIYIDGKNNIKNVKNYKSNEGKINDICKESNTNNFIYIGEWTNDMREGKGTYYNPITKEKYEGEFKNGKAEGKGIFYYNNGDIYKGEFKNWNKEGFGIYFYHNGDRYMGLFKNGIPENNGKYYFKSEKA